MRRLVCGVWLIWMPFAAQAASPSELHPYFKSKTPYSNSVLSVLWMDVYHISLWTDDAVWKPDSRYALSITYNMNFSADELVERTCDEMQRHAADGKSLCLSLHDTLIRVMPGVKSGNRITAIRLDDGKSLFYKDGFPTGNINNRQFSDAFFAIWLGENSSAPSLRQQLVERK